MIVYSEEKEGRLSIFKATVIDADGEVISTRKVVIRLNQVVMDGFTYFCLYDDQMSPVTDAYQYLNYGIREAPLTTRSFAATAIRLLYCFLSLSGCRTDVIDEKTYRSFLFFLRGINTNPKNFAMLTQRSNDTVNGYLSVYRKYFKYVGIECEAIYKSHTIQSEYASDSSIITERIKYDNNLRTSDNSDTVPKYISPAEMRRIYKLLTKAGDRQGKIIVRLMYVYGLRLGEVLGITIEDICEVYKNGKLVYVIYLRNRMSDHTYQFAKWLPHVIEERGYASKEYRAGTVEIIITHDFFVELMSFIDETHSEFIKKKPENYATGVADIVSVKDRPETNHYVFLNKNGNVLSDETWNNHLRGYFKEAGIMLDTEVRENNLSHRFRHGFAMYHAHFSPHPKNAIELAKMLRHKSVSTVMKYYNPTPEDEFKIKTEFQNELYDMIPELKEGLNNEGSDAV